MRRHYSLTYLISQAFKSLFRNGMMTVTSIAVLLACLIVMGSFALLVININYNLDQLGALNEIVVHCEVDSTEDEVKEIGRQIRALDNVDAEKVSIITKDDALTEERQKYYETYPDLFDRMDEDGVNPYPDSYVVTYMDNDNVDNLKASLEKIEGVDNINCRADIAETIESLKNSVILVFSCFLVILFLASVFVIINTIKLAVFSRRQEISIMRYVGATKAFIATPFVFEGAVIGLVSSAITFGVVWYGYTAVEKMVTANYGMITLIPFADLCWPLLAAFAGVGIVTGIVGSSISLSKYLKA